MSHEGIFALPDGRRLGYAEYGDLSGEAVLLFHPTPGSRLDAEQTDPGNLHLISVDRPGYGRSDPQPGRTLAQFAQDVERIADYLGVGDFSVAGVSGGGPHALACAALLPLRVTRAAVMCGVGPLSEMHAAGLLNDAGQPPAQEDVAAQAAAIHENAAVIAQTAVAQSPARDRELFTAERVARWVHSTMEATQTPDGMLGDYRIFIEPWGFPLSAVQVPVGLWYGDEDGVVPLAQGRYLAANLPNATLHVLPGLGHLGTPLEAVGEVMAFLRG